MYEVQCGELNEQVRGVANAISAAEKALEQSPAEDLALLIRVRARPGGKWVYLDTEAVASGRAASVTS